MHRRPYAAAIRLSIGTSAATANAKRRWVFPALPVLALGPFDEAAEIARERGHGQEGDRQSRVHPVRALDAVLRRD